MTPARTPGNFHILFLFLDGVGLGMNDPKINPLARAEMPALQRLLGGRRLLFDALPKPEASLETKRASLLAVDASLGITGVPQSATGQAALLTGQNLPAHLGYHYGPKPNPEIAATLRNGSLFSLLRQHHYRAALLNAYPPRYFQAIQSGKRLYSAIPLAVASAGIPLKTQADLLDGQALSADFTAEGWRTHLELADTPLLAPSQAGEALARLAQDYDFAMFEFWLSDYAGHGQDMSQACSLLETFDRVLEGLLNAWDDQSGLILITSDHGNLEDLSTRRHTLNPVPALLVGGLEYRRRFSEGLKNLTDIPRAILRSFQVQD
jgi:hypothetical protein